MNSDKDLQSILDTVADIVAENRILKTSNEALRQEIENLRNSEQCKYRIRVTAHRR